MKTPVLLAALAALIPLSGQAAVPAVDAVGLPGESVCRYVNGQAVKAVHTDKIIFQLIGHPSAVLAADQAAIGQIPLNDPLDIKVMDDPTTVADLKGKVLSFLGAQNTQANRQLVKVIDVDYAVVCPSVPQPG